MKRFRGRATWLLAGLAMGLLFGLGTTAGLMYSGRTAVNPAVTSLPSHPAWPQGLPLHASTAATSDSLAMATGRVDDQVEGLFTLDFITGDLQCFVLNPRIGKFVGWFKTNVTTQLPVEKGKKPSYVMTTGTWEPVGASTNQRPAGCVVYVADANTGMFAAYTFPWVKGAASSGVLQSTPMIPLDGNKARNIVLRSE
ncbi:hypothetical protein NA78x_005866 [Anatilimnocola sp. NA78]|uniref:hypothetical protein n=1 Tax=Anatilimnocola sp. NA78 TaxID=3415683 RepID=UPI003CE5304F